MLPKIRRTTNLEINAFLQYITFSLYNYVPLFVFQPHIIIVGFWYHAYFDEKNKVILSKQRASVYKMLLNKTRMII